VELDPVLILQTAVDITIVSLVTLSQLYMSVNLELVLALIYIAALSWIDLTVLKNHQKNHQDEVSFEQILWPMRRKSCTLLLCI
jgi:hypothetical protein